MLKNTRLQMIAMLAIGGLLGHATAAGAGELAGKVQGAGGPIPRRF